MTPLQKGKRGVKQNIIIKQKTTIMRRRKFKKRSFKKKSVKKRYRTYRVARGGLRL